MAAYNAERFVDEAIKSILKQSFSDWQLIVINDGSTDRTSSIVQSYSALDERIQLINQMNSGSAGAARNAALKRVQGRYCQMLDSDDLLSEDFLDAQYDISLKINPDIIVPNLVFFDKDTTNVIRKWNGNNGNYETINGEKGFYLSLDWTIHGFFTVRTKLLTEIKYESDLINGDEFTTRKLLYNASKIAFSKCHYFYRLNSFSTTRDNKNQVKMFQCLTTDYNLYKYALTNNMPVYLKKTCAKKLIHAFRYYQNIYKEKNKEWSLEDRKYVRNMMIDVYSRISIIEMIKLSSFFSLFLCLTGKKYPLFELYIVLKIKMKKIFGSILKVIS